MDVISTAAGMAFHGGLGAFQSTDFGRRGMAVGGAVGAAGFLVGKQFDDGTLQGALTSGFISGSVQAGFSTAQELFSFKNPSHISSASSINTTTTATAMANSMYAPFTKEGREGFKRSVKENGKVPGALAWVASNQLTPENVLTDFVKKGMVHNDLSAGMDVIMSSFGIDKKNGKMSLVNSAKTLWADNMEQATVADNPKGWFSNEPTTIETVERNMMGQPIGENGKPLIQEFYNKDGIKMDVPAGKQEFGLEKWKTDNHIDEAKTKYFVAEGEYGHIRGAETKPRVSTTNLTGKETISERMSMFIDANKASLQDAISGMNTNLERSGGKPAFHNVEEYKSYLKQMEGGALGTYKELKRVGVYGENASLMRKASGMAVEAFTGSPLWARTLDKQMTSGKATLEHTTGAKGPQVHIRGGGRFGRIAAIAGDIALGGALNAGLNAALWAASAPFKGKSGHGVKANNAFNPI